MNIIVMQIGCLECGDASYLLGQYDTVNDALLAHPDALLRNLMQDDDWRYHKAGSHPVIFEGSVTWAAS